MSREIRRVPLDFAHPLKEVWPGYLLPGEGYQLWETISEGSPVSPVFATPAELATWIKTHGSEFDGRNTPHDQLVAWIDNVGVSIGTAAIVPGRGLVSGVELAAERVARPQADEAG